MRSSRKNKKSETVTFQKNQDIFIETHRNLKLKGCAGGSWVRIGFDICGAEQNNRFMHVWHGTAKCTAKLTMVLPFVVAELATRSIIIHLLNS